MSTIPHILPNSATSRVIHCRRPLGSQVGATLREGYGHLSDAPPKPGRWPRGERGCRHLATFPEGCRGSREASTRARGSFTSVPGGAGPAPAPPRGPPRPAPSPPLRSLGAAPAPARFMWPGPRRPAARSGEAAASGGRRGLGGGGRGPGGGGGPGGDGRGTAGAGPARPSSGRPAAACASAGGCCGCRAARCSPRSSSSRFRPRCSTSSM